MKGNLQMADISMETRRHAIIAQGAEEIYQGHPTAPLTKVRNLMAAEAVESARKAGNECSRAFAESTVVCCTAVVEYSRRATPLSLEKRPGLRLMG